VSEWIYRNKVAWLVVIVGLGVGIDQGSKLWALDALTRPATAEEIQLDTDCRDKPRKGLAAEDPCRRYRPHFVTEHGQRVVTKDAIPVVDGWFGFKYAENPAAAFSLTGSIPANLRWPFLVLISSLAGIGITIWYLKLKERDWAIFTAFPLIIAGAVGNLIDRVRLAYVIDFLDAYVSSPPELVTWLRAHAGTSHWPTFNIADSCIVVGAFFVIYRTVRPLPTPKPDADTAQAAPATPAA
jgi:signal peptidase II